MLIYMKKDICLLNGQAVLFMLIFDVTHSCQRLLKIDCSLSVYLTCLATLLITSCVIYFC